MNQMNPNPPLKKSSGAARRAASLSETSFKTKRSKTIRRENVHKRFWTNIASRMLAPSFTAHAVSRSEINGYENLAPAYDGFCGGKLFASVKLSIAPR